MEDDKSVVSPYGIFIIGCASLVFSIILHVYWLEKYNELTGHKTLTEGQDFNRFGPFILTVQESTQCLIYVENVPNVKITQEFSTYCFLNIKVK